MTVDLKGAPMSDGASGGDQVFLVSIDPADFERTVAQPVDLASAEGPPDALSDLESARLGVAPSGTRSEETFERMAPGDLVLFYAEGGYVGVGRVGATIDDGGWTADTLWEGDGSSLVYTIEGFVPLDIARAAVNRLFDYGPGYTPSGLMRVAPDRVGASVPAIELAVQRFNDLQA